MENRFKINILLSFFLLFYNSCVSEYSFSEKNADEGILIVEGHIIGNSTNYIYLSRTTSLNSENSFIPESGAEIFLQSNGEKISGKANEYEAGIYTLDIGTLDPHLSYSIYISASGDTFQSKEIYPVSTPEIDEITWEKKGNGEPINLYVSTLAENTDVSYFKWTFTEDWEFTANYYINWFVDETNYTYYESSTNPGYYCWDKDTSHQILISSTKDLKDNQISEFKIHSIECDNIKVSELYSITVSQTGISENGYKYYENKKKLNEEMGGLFSPQPSELKGNISCINNPEKEVIGFIDFTINSTQQRIFIQGDLVYEYPNSRTCHEIYKWEREEVLIDMGYHPIMSGANISFWVQKQCVDCRETGTKNKPDFWPNDHE